MSSYMSSFSTMDAVLTFRNRVDPQERSQDDLTREGRALLELNAVAVRGLYDSSKAEGRTFDAWFLSNDEIAGDYVFQPRTESMVVLYKCLACWLYQCAEAPAYGTKVFKRWHAFKESHAFLYGDHPEYDDAPWGLDMFGQDEVWTLEAQEAKWAEYRQSN